MLNKLYTALLCVVLFAMIWPTIVWLTIQVIKLISYIIHKFQYETRKKQSVVVVYPDGRTDYVGQM